MMMFLLLGSLPLLTAGRIHSSLPVEWSKTVLFLQISFLES
ncbi:Bgt-51532 [Blumeria graminis f. sp. tritici]|uniref:Bgt-51532 n=1 Tax=Blumeria graminis f. sp. tritici TaxID=62690 RepID=A0A9X9LBB1_BLUGR|nr:Bgt-51532 [Blumeria graminis f. sp. tritici]